MTGKNAGWIIIGVAVILGILRLANVISDAVTAVLFILSVIIFASASKGFKKKKGEKPYPKEPGKPSN